MLARSRLQSRALGSVAEPRPELIAFSHLRWDFVWQRPQHLLSRAARQWRVLFVEEPVFRPGAVPYMSISDRPQGVRVAVPVLPEGLDHSDVMLEQRDLVDALVGPQKESLRILWYYTPMAMAFSADIEADLVVYDNMDELSLFRGASCELVDFEAALLSRADLLFTGGMSLYEAKRHRHHSVHAFPSSIDVTHFLKARQLARSGAAPFDLADLPRPRVGFFGVIDERMDLDLVAALAALRPEWQFVMIGPVVKIDEAALPRAGNIHWLGLKSYAELPRYLAGLDAGLMPFAMNEATRFIPPTKTPEYLAAGVPVVSTPITDVVRPYGERGLVEIARTPQDAARSIEGLLRSAREPPPAQGRPLPRRRLLGQDLRRHASPDGAGPGRRRGCRREPPARASRRRVIQGADPMYDWLIVGAGFAGSVLAERLATRRNERVLLIDRRDHVGGNAYDRYDGAGLLVHQYGPHIFHTNSKADLRLPLAVHGMAAL